MARVCNALSRSSSKRVDVMHGAGKAGNQAALLQRRQRIARNAVLRVPDVEAPVFRAFEMADVVGDAGFDHRRHVPAPDGASRHA